MKKREGAWEIHQAHSFTRSVRKSYWAQRLWYNITIRGGASLGVCEKERRRFVQCMGNPKGHTKYVDEGRTSLSEKERR